MNFLTFNNVIIHDLNKLVSIETIEPKVSYKLRLLKQISFLGFVLQKGGYYQYDSFITDDLFIITLSSLIVDLIFKKSSINILNL